MDVHRDSGYAKDIDEGMIPNEPTLSRLEKSIGLLCSLFDIQASGELQVLYLFLLLRRLVAKANIYLCAQSTQCIE
jgi:hypothetical protein